MATYHTDFSGYATGSLPSDWTDRGTVTGKQTVEATSISGTTGGQGLQVADVGGGHTAGMALHPNDVANVTYPVRIQTRAWCQGNVYDTINTPIVAGRGDWGSGTHTGIFLTVNGGLWGFFLRYFQNNISSYNEAPIGSGGGWSQATKNIWINNIIEYLHDGTNVIARCKFWTGDVEDEPGTWLRSGTLHPDFVNDTPSGYVGVGVRFQAPESGTYQLFDWVDIEYVPATLPPGASVIFAAPVSTTEITITHTTPGSGATTHDLYAAYDPADLELPIDPEFLIAADLGPEPAPVVESGLTPGQTRYYRSIAKN